MIAFLFHTGLRVQELCNMKMSDVSYHEGNPRVLSVIGKGNKERKVALNEEAARALTYWTRRVRRDIVVDLPPTRDSDFVWLIPAGKSKGQPIKPPAVRAMLRKLGNMAGIHVHPHKLRHSYGTEAVRNGAKPHAIQRSMGHASLATTGMYLHADEAELEQVAAVLPKVLSG
jgi:site-specific recombinase XerD